MTSEGQSQRRRPRIALFAAPESSASVLYGLYDTLLSVGPMWPDMTGIEVRDPPEPLLDVQIVARTREPFRCFGNILVEPTASIDDIGSADAVVICDTYSPISIPPRGRYEVEGRWLRAAHRDGALIGAVCSGSLLVAESALLDGRSCAGHWAYADLFRDAYPRIRFLPEAILNLEHVDDGIVTAGGVTSWQELALYLIGRFCGPEQAARTAKVYLLGSHADGQQPFSAMTRRPIPDDAVIRDAVAWVAENVATPNPVTAMTDRSGLLPRTFARRFQAATGRRPIEFVHGLRIEEARRQLELGDRPVDEVGFAVGYADPTFFRRLFKRTTGLTPAAYRRRYAAIGA